MTQANQNEKLIPVFQDEVHFQVQTTITRKWAEKGSEPKVMSKPGKNNVAYSGFVIPETGELTVTKPGWFNYESVIQSFREFIKTKPCPDGKKYCIILEIVKKPSNATASYCNSSRRPQDDRIRVASAAIDKI